jgi:hypothetical protein
MAFIKHLVAFALLGSAMALPHRQGPWPVFPTNRSCGEVNVFYTYAIHSGTLKQERRSNRANRGFTAYHPYVIAQGLDPAEVDGRLRNGTAAIVKAGYNLRGKIPKATHR